MSVIQFLKGLTGSTAASTTSTVVLEKKIGDDVLISIDLENLQESTFAGMNLVYPSVVKPKLLNNGIACDVINGNLWSGLPTELLANDIMDHDTGQKYVYVSKVVKMGQPAEQSGRLVTVKFQCVAKGTGIVALESISIGRILNGWAALYEPSSNPLQFDIETPVEPPPVPLPGMVICIINVE